ncbi:MFS transporter [Chloroflexota bacterium]
MFLKFREKIFYGWVIVLNTIIISLILSGVRRSFGVFFKPLASEFNLTRATTSSLYSIHMLLSAFFTIVGGWALDKYGPRFVFLLMGFFTGFCFLLSSLTNSFWQLYLSYSLLLAIGTASIYPVLHATVSKWFEKKRGLATGLAGTGPSLGLIIFAPFSAFLIFQFDWRIAYQVIGVIIWLVILPLSRLLRNNPNEIGFQPDGAAARTTIPEDKDEIFQLTSLSLSQALKSRNYWIFSPVWLCMGFGNFLVYTHIVPFATDANITTMQAATIISVIGGAAIPVGILMGKISDKIGRKIPIITASLLRAGAFVGLIFTHELWMFNLCAIIFGISIGTGHLFAALSVDIFGKKSIGVIMGILNLVFTIGAAIGPFIGGLVYDVNNNYNIAFLIGAISSVMAALLISLIKVETQRDVLGGKGPNG